MPRTYIPVDKATREKLYGVKRGDTWDALLQKMLRTYRAEERAVRRGKGGRRGQTKA